MYHFTPLENIEAIKKHGILPQEVVNGMLPPGECVVWLTTTPTTEMSEDDSDIFEARGNGVLVTKRWLRGFSDEPLARFTVNLQPNSRWLHHYETWTRDRYWDGRPDPSDSWGRDVREKWWIYFGVIPPSKITECIIEEVPCQTSSIALLNSARPETQTNGHR